jgi:hypothetical protein
MTGSLNCIKNRWHLKMSNSRRGVTNNESGPLCLAAEGP